MRLEKHSGCKVNLLLNILGKRADGFHELETVMHPVSIFDHLTINSGGEGIVLTCSHPELPTDSRNLVYKAASLFFERTGIKSGVRLDLVKNIPLAAGLGGGSANAATTLIGLNELFGSVLNAGQLRPLAAELGSDVPFFLQNKPALATGRGEQIQPMENFAALDGAYIVLIHPGFGISTAWAYHELGRFPEALSGKMGRAQELISLLKKPNLRNAAGALYNSLEAPALHKYPILSLYQDFLLEHGAQGTLMSGSGSSTFALAASKSKAEAIAEKFKNKFGDKNWMAIVPA
jgi:4-diphosphocytidyl-2-C-methyl-D-erythritol kinase